MQPLHKQVRCLVKPGEPKAPQEARAEARDVEREANAGSAAPESQSEAWLLE
jgi:hypothetical protein